MQRKHSTTVLKRTKSSNDEIVDNNENPKPQPSCSSFTEILTFAISAISSVKKVKNRVSITHFVCRLLNVLKNKSLDENLIRLIV